ncbi:hypothetical protein ACQP1P_46540 [Dactylosporangium sp. CA-052675]|uniref:hypothetical protein n=1 Tax=Dactylosporangium sp. CA-052675 TaxID=3239927 RepID=UPI003D8ED0EB
MEFDGVQELRSQIGVAAVVATWSPGSASVDLRVAEGSRQSRRRNGCIPVDAAVHGDRGEYIGEILVWLDEGTLSALEYAWVTDEMPTMLPQIDRITMRQRK